LIEIIGEVFLGIISWILGEVVFHGLCYFTGKTLTRLVTFGKYYPGDFIKDKEQRKAQRSESNKFTYTKGEKKYINFEVVSLIGLIFWVIVALIFFLFAVNSI
jgi:hypothetical protein